MSRRKRDSIAAGSASESTITEPGGSADGADNIVPNKIGVIAYLRARLWLVAVIALLALGTLGAGLKYLDEDAKRELAKNSQDRSFISSINPFVPAPPPPATPQLSKEYIYAGSRLLAVEDAAASAIPPADLAIWRPSSGLWCVLGRPGSAQTIYGWGTNGDLPGPGDYDGDGKTDFAVYRVSTATWYVLKTSDGTYYGVTQGAGVSGFIPVPGDYDGDGKTDTALFNSGTSSWNIIQSSTGGGYSVTWGASGDKSAQADYDGDGKADLAVWRPSDKTFYYLPSTGGSYQYATLGSTSLDTPVPGDYTGDGKADMAVFSSGNWIIRDSATGTTNAAVAWGGSKDIPVQNDYDGDGKIDLATWRNSNGHWYIKNSSGAADRDVAWGMAGDIPVPALYRR